MKIGSICHREISSLNNNYLYYSFQVTAKGSPDVSLSWLYDLQLSVAKLIGKLLSSSLNPITGEQMFMIYG